MNVRFTKQARNNFKQYEETLINNPKYFVPRKTRIQKLWDFRKHIMSLTDPKYDRRVCLYSQMGQVFNDNKEPQRLHLKISKYDDKTTDTSWYISFYKKKDEIVILKIRNTKKITKKMYEREVYINMIRKMLFSHPCRL